MDKNQLFYGPKVQVVTESELLAGKKPNLTPTMLPYMKAAKSLFSDDGLF